MNIKIRTISIIAVFILFCNTAKSHVFEVAQYNDWGKGYLTIIDNHVIYDVGENSWFSLTWENDLNINIPVGTVITGVNGETAYDMSPNEFYKITDSADTFSLKCIIRFIEGELEIKITNKKDLREDVANIIETRPGERFFTNNDDDLVCYDREIQYKYLNINVRELYDESFDFSKIRTYDFLINSDDPLFDYKILDNLPLFFLESRDTVNPDVIFTIAKSADESISATYVPPTSRTINTGSYTTSKYNYLTHKYDYVTRNNTKTIHEGGYTETTKVANIFLEIAMLDAKQINNPNKTHAPIIWQITFKRDVVNPKFNIEDELISYAEDALFPPADRLIKRNGNLYEDVGLTILHDKKHIIVTEVRENSQAEKAGLRVGDELLYYDGHNKKYYQDKGYSGYYFSFVKKKEIFTIKREKKKMNIVVYPTKQNNWERAYWVTPEQLEKSRK